MIINKEHSYYCLSNLWELRKTSKLCDMIIEAEGSIFPVHKAVLASSTPYFMAMFCNDMEEATKSHVIIRDISSLAMELIINYCYSGEIDINENNVQCLLPAASLMQLEFVRQSCCDFLKNQLCPTNCLGVLSFAHTHDCRDLKDTAHNYARHHYLDILESEEFLEQSLEELIQLLQSDDLNIRNESQVYESVMKWIKYDTDNRKEGLSKLLEHVRLPLISAEYLVSNISCDPLIKQSGSCRDLVDEAKDYLLLPEHRSRLKSSRTRPRMCFKPNDVLFAVGGWCNGDAINMVERYNPKIGDWSPVSNMNKRRCGVGIAVLNNLLYAIGGHDGGSYLNSVERYDPVTDNWSGIIAPTNTCRTSVGVAVLNDHIYAVGGQDGISCLNIVECYDPGQNRWCQVASMSTQRLGVAVGVVDGQLYAVGGSNGTCPLNTVERYDPRDGKWSFVSPMQIKRKHLGVAINGDWLYAVGGRDESYELSSVERYDPSADYWYTVVAMNERRSGLGLCVLNSTLYSIGGFNGTSYLKSTEYLDSCDYQWRPGPLMNYRRLGCGVGILNI